MTGLQAFNTINSNSFAKGFVCRCLILMLFTSLSLFDSEPLHAQSSASDAAAVALNRIPSSITAAQRSTEAILQRATSTFSLRYDETLEASNFFEMLRPTVFIDTNLEGVFDSENELTLRTGVSMAKSLQRALREHDSVYTVEPDGSILIISIDDEHEPDYMQTVIYDVTTLTGTFNQSEHLGYWISQSISSDSWEQNGGGNGVISIYMHNGHILMSITQAYSVHLKIRRHLWSTNYLAGETTATPAPLPAVDLIEDSKAWPNGPHKAKLASSVVQVPSQHTKSNRRKRRGFSRPDSGSSSGFGGAAGGVLSVKQ